MPDTTCSGICGSGYHSGSGIYSSGYHSGSGIYSSGYHSACGMNESGFNREAATTSGIRIHVVLVAGNK